MKVAFDTSGTHVAVGGVKTYIVELLKAISERSTGLDVIPFERKVHLDRSGRIKRSVDTLYNDVYWTQLGMKRSASMLGADVLHAPAFLAPLASSIPCVVTIHDLYFLRQPDAFKTWSRWISQIMIPMIVRRAERIIAVSEFTKCEILELMPGIDPEKIVVTHLGVSPRFRLENITNRDLILQKYRLSKPYLLSACTIEPRKNLMRLLEAFAKLIHKIDHDLILVGAYGWKQSGLASAIHRLGIADRVRTLGYVAADELPALYVGAALFVYPSIYEGFGFPPLEAMAAGCPVITSNTSSLKEIAGAGALLVDPHDMNAISEAILSVASSESVMQTLITAGRKRSLEYSWQKCAEKTLAVYNELEIS